MARSRYDMASMVLIIISLVLIIASLSTAFPWARFDRTREIGPVEYTLKASCDPLGFEYELTTKASQGGIIGGGLGGNVSVDPGRKTYPEANGKFLDNIGLIYDSYRDKEFVYELKMQDPPEGSGVPWNPAEDPSAYLDVNLHSDSVPFWSTAGRNGMEVTITFSGCDLSPPLDPSADPDFQITIDSIEVVGSTDVDDGGSYVGDELVLFSSDEGWTLKEVNGSVTVGFSSKFPSGGAKVMGIKARIEAHLTDFWGRAERQTLSGNAGHLNVYPVGTGTLVQVAGIPLSVVAVAVSIISGAISLLLIIRGRGSFKILSLTSSFLGLAAAAWFFLGMRAAVSLLGQRLDGAEGGLTFGLGLYICIAGSVLMLIAGSIGFARGKAGKRGDAEAGRFKVVP